MITISLPDSLQAFVDNEVATKGFANVSAYFQNLLREAQSKAHDARLEALLLEGLASKSMPIGAEWRAALESQVTAILVKHADRPKP